MEAPPLEQKPSPSLPADVASYRRLMEIDEEGDGPLCRLSARSPTASSPGTREEFTGPLATAFLPRSGVRWRQCNARSKSRMNWLTRTTTSKKIGDAISHRNQCRRRHAEGRRYFRRQRKHRRRVWKGWPTQAVSAFRAAFTITSSKSCRLNSKTSASRASKISPACRVYRLVMSGRGPELRSSRCVTPSPEVAADLRSLFEGEPIAPASDKRPWKSSLGSNQKQRSCRRVRSLSRAIA